MFDHKEEEWPMELTNTIIAVDFDNTLCFSNWPELGEPNLPLIKYLKQQKSLGSKLILWICRAGNCANRRIPIGAKICVQGTL